MNSTLSREKPLKPKGAWRQPRPSSFTRAEPRPVIVTRAEVAPCTCPDPCERDHEHD